MAIAVEMPKMSDTMEEGVLVAWMVDEGATVATGDIIAQVETDKATMDLESFDDGVLLKKAAAVGDAIPIGGLIAILGKAGEDVTQILEKYGAASERGGPAASKPTAPAGGDGVGSDIGDVRPAVPSSHPASGDGGDDTRVKSSPLARKLAVEHGIDLVSLRGTGPDGRIVKRDIEAALSRAPLAGAAADVVAPAVLASPRPAMPPSVAAPAVAPASPAKPAPVVLPVAAPPVETTPDVVRISQMRKAISRRLSESKFTSPHFYLTVDVDMEQAIAVRTEINRLAETHGEPKVSFNDLITKACATALRYHPAVNASYAEDEGVIRYHKQIHVAVAVAVEDGLITPIIWNADTKGLRTIAAETQALAERARNRQLQPEDYTGSTFTTSNLGMFGITEFTAIINPPNACILAIGAIRDEAVVTGGALAAGKRMKLTLSCDHRIVDGATGARFLASLVGYLEYPATMLL
jgi:pyruvate dehydrogenase E2 component (dihydrolipoamide acetyltransferase)